MKLIANFILFLFLNTKVLGTIKCSSDSILLSRKNNNKKTFVSESIIKNIFLYTSYYISFDKRINQSNRVIDRIRGVPFLEEDKFFHFEFSPSIDKFVYDSEEYYIHSYEFFFSDFVSEVNSYLPKTSIPNDFGNGYCKLMSYGTIAVTCDLRKVLFLGGFLYKDTITNYYSSCTQDSNKVKKYLELKYINYLPENIIVYYDNDGRIYNATFHSSLLDVEFRVIFHKETDELVFIKSNQVILSFERESPFLFLGIPKLGELPRR